MNWRKEGYQVGDTVFLTKKEIMYFTPSDGIYVKQLEGEVTYVGVSVLKVEIKEQDKKKTLTFNKGLRYTRSYSGAFGYSYAVYKSEEEFQDIMEKTVRENILVEEIQKSNLNILDEEALKKIKNLIDKEIARARKRK